MEKEFELYEYDSEGFLVMSASPSARTFITCDPEDLNDMIETIVDYFNIIYPEKLHINSYSNSHVVVYDDEPLCVLCEIVEDYDIDEQGW